MMAEDKTTREPDFSRITERLQDLRRYLSLHTHTPTRHLLTINDTIDLMDTMEALLKAIVKEDQNGKGRDTSLN